MSPALVVAGGVALDHRLRVLAILAVAGANDPWFWGVADAVALGLLLLTLLVVVALIVRRVRLGRRARREQAFRGRIDEVFAELDPRTSRRDREWLGEQIAAFDGFERPLAALALVERMKPVADEERAHALAVLREVGTIELLVRACRGRMPWRRAGAIGRLGWIRAADTVPVVMQRVGDRNRHVRESAVRALGQMRGSRAIGLLCDLFRSPGPVGEGVVYDALISYGRAAEPVFVGALGSSIESVRVASCFGVAATAEHDAARRVLEQLLDDESSAVRVAAADALAQVGTGAIPDALVRAARDEVPTVRSAATRALGSYDDACAVDLGLEALRDPDRDTAVGAGEALVRLSRRPAAGPSARAALEGAAGDCAVRRALILARIGSGEG
jgi:HEAT repeat protein